MKERRTGRVNRIIATERLSEISSASFQTESVDFSRGSLQFSNGFSRKLLFHLSFNRNARRLWRPVLQIEEGTYWGQSTNENYTLSIFQKKKTQSNIQSISQQEFLEKSPVEFRQNLKQLIFRENFVEKSYVAFEIKSPNSWPQDEGNFCLTRYQQFLLYPKIIILRYIFIFMVKNVSLIEINSVKNKKPTVLSVCLEKCIKAVQ